MGAALENPIFSDEAAAREAFEAIVWPEGKVCPHCGNADQNKIAKARGRSAREGLYYCGRCNGQFTATVGTVLAHSKVPLTKWWLAAQLFACSKHRVTTQEIRRALGVTYKTAWFMSRHIRDALNHDEQIDVE